MKRQCISKAVGKAVGPLCLILSAILHFLPWLRAHALDLIAIAIFLALFAACINLAESLGRCPPVGAHNRWCSNRYCSEYRYLQQKQAEFTERLRFHETGEPVTDYVRKFNEGKVPDPGPWRAEQTSQLSEIDSNPDRALAITKAIEAGKAAYLEEKAKRA